MATKQADNRGGSTQKKPTTDKSTRTADERSHKTDTNKDAGRDKNMDRR